jgi:hypothetical protein
MGELTDARRLFGLRWSEMIERSWPWLVRAGLPRQLASLAKEIGRHKGRPILAYTLPMLEEAGVASLAVPFVAEDGVLLDPGLVSSAGDLARVVAFELAYMLHPWWEDPDPERHEKIERFASNLAPKLLSKRPDYPMEEFVLFSLGRRAILN